MKTGKSPITLEFDARERQLIASHGYPFERLKRELEAHADSDAVARIPCDPYELERLLGDLAYSINRCKSPTLQEELDAIYEYVQATTGL